MQRMGRERHRVFVKSGVTVDTTEDLMQKHFSAFGTVTDVYIPRSLPGPVPKGFAYVSFETEAAVQKAVKEAVHEIEGKHYPVGRAEPRPSERSAWHNHHQERSPMRVAEPLLPFPPRYSRSISPRGGLLPNPQHNGGPVRLDLRSSFAHSPQQLPLDAGGPLRDGPPFGSRPALPFPDSFGYDGGRRGGASGRMPLDILPGEQISRSSGRMPLLPGEQISRSSRLFVGGLPDALVERHIRAHFQKFGVVEDVYFPRERHTGNRRGFCFVRFDSNVAAHFAAVQTPHVILGHKVGEIKVANERADDIVGNEEEAVELGLDVDRLPGYGPERGHGHGLELPGYGPERGYGLELPGYGPERGHGLELPGYGPEMGHIGLELPGYGPERGHGLELPGYGPERGHGLELPGYGPERGHGLERGNAAFLQERSYGPIRAHVPEQMGYRAELGFRADRRGGGLKQLAPIPYQGLGREFQRELPRDFPEDLPRELLGEFPRDLPREFAGDFPGDIPRDYPRDLPLLPRGSGSRPSSIRYWPY